MTAALDSAIRSVLAEYRDREYRRRPGEPVEISRMALGALENAYGADKSEITIEAPLIPPGLSE